MMKKVLKIAGIFFGYLLTTVVALFCFILLVCLILVYGPSEDAGDLFVRSCQETSALKFLPYWFLPADTVDDILGKNEKSPAAVTAADAVGSFSAPLKYDPADLEDLSEEDRAEKTASAGENTAYGEPYIEEVNEGIYKGMIMIVPDPSRVVIGTLPNYSEGGVGKLLSAFIEDYGAIGGTNAGGFYDPGGRGLGGCPDGMVIEDGNIRYGADKVYKNVIGFNADHRLMLGDWTPSQAIAEGVVSAVSFYDGLVLVKDGIPQQGLNSGVNPRTAIGQREDGTVLLLVIEGRHAGSLGATADDLRDIFVRYGAVNASMLDGGTSAVMFFKGEQVTRGSNLLGMRYLPTAMLVLPAEDSDLVVRGDDK
ncbi:MAG: phosphodiester glycosidase family protein [Lachnospiraceae bacterium]|nr:phosphodiester glycosidase family protein [Lachnospiraceae bacterium]